MKFRVTVTNIRNLQKKGINVLALTPDQATNIDTIDAIVRECAGDEADNILATCTLGEVMDCIRASFLPAK